MKMLLPYFFLLLTNYLLAQAKNDVSIKIDTNLSLKMIHPPKERNVNGVRVYEDNKDSIYFQVMVNDSLLLVIKDEKTLNISLTGVHAGLISHESYNDYDKSSRDTILGNAPGKFIALHNNNKDANLTNVFYFVTIQDNHSYIIGTYVIGPLTQQIEKEIIHFFSNLEFSGYPYPGYSKKSKN